MDLNDSITLEIIKSGLLFLVVVLLGGAISALWAAKQKRRELDLVALGQLYDSYGKFISTRRIWNELRKQQKDAGLDITNEKNRLFNLANNLEGEVESILLRVTAEKQLSPEDLNHLGCFRQSFQSLRESIRDGQTLKYGCSEHPEYIALKNGTLFVSYIFNRNEPWMFAPSLKQSKIAFKAITSNKHERKT